MKRFLYSKIYNFHKNLDGNSNKRLSFGLLTTILLILPINLIDNIWDNRNPMWFNMLLGLMVLTSMFLFITRMMYSHGTFSEYTPKKEIDKIWNKASVLWQKDINHKKCLKLYKKFLTINEKYNYYKDEIVKERIESLETVIFREKRLKKLLR